MEKNKKKKKEKATLFEKALLANYELADSISLAIGESIAYPIKTILNLINREKKDLQIIILKKKERKKIKVLDLQTK